MQKTKLDIWNSYLTLRVGAKKKEMFSFLSLIFIIIIIPPSIKAKYEF